MASNSASVITRETVRMRTLPSAHFVISTIAPFTVRFRCSSIHPLCGQTSFAISAVDLGRGNNA